MSKALEGGLMLAGAAGMGVAAFMDPALVASPFFDKVMAGLVLGGISMEAGAIASALTSNRAMAITTRQVAAARQVIYGEQRVGGVTIYQSTTGGHYDQWNYIIVLAGHECDSIIGLYLDGRQVYFDPGSPYGITVSPGGISFGGNADGNTRTGPGGQQYNFGTLVYCEARYGNQPAGDVIGAVSGNDPNWVATSSGTPSCMGCCYVYLKVEYDANMFPQEPEIRFTVRGKNNIYDPRTGTTGYTTNTALCIADVLLDPTFGLGDNAAPQIANGTFELGDTGWLQRSVGFSIATNPTFSSPDGQGGVWCGLFNSGQGTTTGEMISDTRVPVTPGEYVSAQGWVYKNTAAAESGQGNIRISFFDLNNNQLPGTTASGGIGYLDGTAIFPSQEGWILSTAAGVAPQEAATMGLSCIIYNCNEGSLLYNDLQFLTPYTSIDTAQLIAAANVCDEQVALASGQTETRYTTHYHYDCTTTPGDVIATMLEGCAGRLSRIGGQWSIFPAYWLGPSFTFDQNSLTGQVSWDPYRSYRDLFNRVNTTYIAPNYPYSVAGDLYDSNGYYEGTTQNGFQFAWQVTNAPPYAADTLHGYAYDQFLEEDGGIPLAKELSLQSVISVAQAQRVAKINLMRNRQTGSGTFAMSLSAWAMQPCDVFQMTFPILGWTERNLEVTGVKFKIGESSGGAYAVTCEMTVQDTDPSVYEWSTTEELTVYDVPAMAIQAPWNPAPPTDMTLTSSAGTALVGLDGTITPRIEVQWSAPLDPFVTTVQVEFAAVTDPTVWFNSGSVDVANTLAYIVGVVSGQQYNVRIRSQRASGAVSDWVEEDGYTVSTTLPIILGMLALAPGTLLAEAYDNGTASIFVAPFQAVYGNASVPILPGGTYTIPNLQQRVLYYVYYVDPSFTGGAITPIATIESSDFLNKQGYYLIDSIVTPVVLTSATRGLVSRIYPTQYFDTGTRTTLNPSAAYTPNGTLKAQVSGSYTYSNTTGFTTTIGSVIYSTFPPIITSTTAGEDTLYVVAAFDASTNSDIEVTIQAWTATGSVIGTLLQTSFYAGLTTYELSLPASLNLNTLSVGVTVDGSTGTNSTNTALAIATLLISSIYVEGVQAHGGPVLGPPGAH